MTPAKDRQKAHRQKVAARLVRMETALRRIIDKLDGTEKPAALAILEIAKEGLAG